MNWDQIEGNWVQFKGKVRERWGKITKDDRGAVRSRGPSRYRRATRIPATLRDGSDSVAGRAEFSDA